MVNPTVHMSSAAPNPTNTSPLSVTVQFSKSVIEFIEADITSSNGMISNFISVDGDTYIFDLNPIGQGVVTAEIAAGVAEDLAGNGNTGSSTFSRTFDSVGPTVTISQAMTQADPTNVSPVNFTVVFSEPVDGFTSGEVTLGGTALPTTSIVTEISPMDRTTYKVEVSGMTQGGTVTAAVGGGVANDVAANANMASTSYDNTVTFTLDTVTGLTSDI